MLNKPEKTGFGFRSKIIGTITGAVLGAFGYNHDNAKIDNSIYDTHSGNLYTGEVIRPINNISNIRISEPQYVINRMEELDNKYREEFKKGEANRIPPSKYFTLEEYTDLITIAEMINLGEIDRNIAPNWLFNDITAFIEAQNSYSRLENILMWKQNLKTNIEEFMRNTTLDATLFHNNIRNRENSLFAEKGGTLVIDYTKINPTLSEDIIKEANKRDLNYRLVFSICTIENNFGISRESKSGALGICQTMPKEVKRFYGANTYENASEEEEKWLHFTYTFDYLALLKNNYNLKIGINDNAFRHVSDFLMAGLLYHDGETKAIQTNKGNIISGSDGERYLKKLFSSFAYQRFIIAKNENGEDISI